MILFQEKFGALWTVVASNFLNEYQKDHYEVWYIVESTYTFLMFCLLSSKALILLHMINAVQGGQQYRKENCGQAEVVLGKINLFGEWRKTSPQPLWSYSGKYMKWPLSIHAESEAKTGTSLRRDIIISLNTIAECRPPQRPRRSQDVLSPFQPWRHVELYWFRPAQVDDLFVLQKTFHHLFSFFRSQSFISD